MKLQNVGNVEKMFNQEELSQLKQDKTKYEQQQIDKPRNAEAMSASDFNCTPNSKASKIYQSQGVSR